MSAARSALKTIQAVGVRGDAGFVAAVRHKPSRAAFEKQAKRRAYPAKPKQRSPLGKRHQTSPSKAASTARRIYFVHAVKKMVDDGKPLKAAMTEVGRGMRPMVCTRERKAWWGKATRGGEYGVDVRRLYDNEPGQGPKTDWTEGHTEKLGEYLFNTPDGGSKAAKGRADWPSCHKIARTPGLADELGLPERTARRYAQIANGAGFGFVHRGGTVFLHRGFRRRRLAFCTKYAGKGKGWWKRVAYQDEGGESTWRAGPWKAWMNSKDPATKKPIKKVKSGDNGRVSFSVLACHGDKAPIHTYTGGLQAMKKDGSKHPGASFEEISLQQIKPFFERNTHLQYIVLDGDKSHPGMGGRNSLAVNKLWREDPVLKEITILAGPDEWDEKGVSRTSFKHTKQDGSVAQPEMTEQAHRLNLARNKMPGVLKVETWPANSPDLNIAEHLVAAIKMPHDWVEGSYTKEQLLKTITEQYNAYDQGSIDRSIASMPLRLAKVVEKGGWAIKHEDYARGRGR